MNHLIEWGLGIFAAFGGIGLVWKLALKEAPAAVDLAFDELDKNPDMKALLLKYRPQIEALFDVVDAEVKSRLDKEAAQGPISHQ